MPCQREEKQRLLDKLGPKGARHFKELIEKVRKRVGN
jgi:hypothetical protein